MIRDPRETQSPELLASRTKQLNNFDKAKEQVESLSRDYDDVDETHHSGDPRISAAVDSRSGQRHLPPRPLDILHQVDAG